MSIKQYHSQLDEYILGSLTAAERKEFEQHLETCPECLMELMKLKDLSSRIAELPKGIRPRRDLWPGIDDALPDKPAELSADKSETRVTQRPRRPVALARLIHLPASRSTRSILQAAAALTIIFGAWMVWTLMKNSATRPEESRVSLPEIKKEKGAAPGQESLITNPASLPAVPGTADRDRVAETGPGGSKKPAVPAGRATAVEPPLARQTGTSPIYESGSLQHLQASFVSYSEHLPNDRIYLQLDKPIYSPGETIWFQAYLRDEGDLGPSRQSDVVHVEFLNPNGSVARRLEIIAKEGTCAGDIDLADNLPGGIYKIKAYTEWQKNVPDSYIFEKEIQVQQPTLPGLIMKLDFQRKAYGPGDNVVAKLDVRTLQNKPLSDSNFTYVVQVAGKTIQEQTQRSDRSGTSYVAFDLPKNLPATDGILGVLIDYGGKRESISRAIPIVLNRIRLTMYPEGGDLVTGLSSRVAFQALNEFDKPADVEGRVFDEEGRVIAEFSSFHEGMGAFELTPESEKKYHASITRPEGISQWYDIPGAREHGYTLSVELGASGDVDLRIGSQSVEQMSVLAQVRGKLYFKKQFTTVRGVTTIPFATDDIPRGVAQVTLFDSNGVEQAERLLFVGRDRGLNVQVSTDKEKYLPREKVTLTVDARDSHGNPIPGDFSLSVADDNLITFADDRAGQILPKMLLEPDLKGKVEEPNFYFDQKEPKAEAALDYLMMTRGWRRFTWKQVIEDQPTVISFPPERTTIAGKVIDGNTGKPVKGVPVIIGKGGQSGLTDSEGRFLFRYIELDTPVALTISGKGFTPFEETIKSYTENLVYTLWKSGTIADIKGRIIDKNTNEPLAGVNVLVVGTVRGAVTDADGNYSIIGVPVGSSVLRASVVGYQTLEKQEYHTAAKGVEINFAMVPSQVQMAEQVITAQRAVVNMYTTGTPSLAVTHGAATSAAADRLQQPKVLREPLKLQPGVVYPGNLAATHAGAGTPLAGYHVGKPVGPTPSKKQTLRYYRAREFPVVTYSPAEVPLVRSDFRSTIFWKGDIRLDGSGQTRVSFYNSDEITAFRATVEGISSNGLVGRAEKTYFTQLPFSMSARVPVEVSMGDQVSVPLTLTNNTSRTVTGALTVASPENWHLAGVIASAVTLAGSSSKTLYIPFNILASPGPGSLTISFLSEGLRDAFEKDVYVREKGFPQLLSFGSGEREKAFRFSLADAIEGTVRAKVTLYPTVTSNLLSAVEAMMQEPTGCFEQASSKNYPNVIALQYLQETGTKDPAVSDRAMKLLEEGYKRLTAYETKEKGYEWFGSTPANEALTAYGLTEFKDMEPIYSSVDKTMIDRTATWLLSRSDKKGGFLQDPKALDSFGRASPEITDAYIVYALAGAGYTNVGPELAAAKRRAVNSQDPYQLALVANAMESLGERDQAKALLSDLQKTRLEDGSWSGKVHSITRSTGFSLKIETTSLALLALLRSENPDPGAIDAGVKFLLASRSGSGGFGSTQGTILALKALTAYAKYSKRTSEAGTVQISLDGSKIVSRSYEAGEKGPLVIDGLEKKMTEYNKSHSLSVEMKETKHTQPYSLAVSWNTTLPRSSDSAKVSISTNLSQNALRMGETVRLVVNLRNRAQEGLPMTLALVGIPGGLSVQPWQLKELQGKRVFDFYEIKGRYVSIYYRQMEPGQERIINLDLKADVPGKYESPASSAYLYYSNEYKSWSSAGPVEVLE